MSEHTERTPVELAQSLVGNGWRTLRTIYYANTVSWRALKSGALVFFGFFLWSSSNLLLSYQPTWTWLQYPMAYGFVLIWYGPLHHLVVIPVALDRRRESAGESALGRHLPNASLAVFLALVVVLGTFPPGVMAFDFQSQLEGSGVDVNPDLLCTKAAGENGTTIHCHLTESKGIDSVAVESSGETLLVDDDPPFEFTIRESAVREVVGQKQFQVVLRDEGGDTIRRYTRTVASIPAA
ncbi:MAG: hypothetical protein ABEJ78_03795 [Haloferacaceae archaeon]